MADVDGRRFASMSSKRLRVERDSLDDPNYDDLEAETPYDSSEMRSLKKNRLEGDFLRDLASVERRGPGCLFGLDDCHDARSALGIVITGTSEAAADRDAFNGGDSGFNDLTSPASTGCGDLSGSDTQMEPCDERHYERKPTSCCTEPESTTSSSFLRDAFSFPDNDSRGNDGDEDDDDDDAASTISHISGLSDLSEMSGQNWKPTAGPMEWVQKQMLLRTNPRYLLQQLVPRGTHIPLHLDNITLWKIIINMVNEPPRRKKLPDVNLLEDVVRLIRDSKKIIVLTGAGVSVSCGIPDFRSRDGIYARLARDFPNLPDPQAMFDIHYFRRDPRPFFKFAKEIYPGQFQPSLCHRFLKLLEERERLLRNYTQNIDTLEQIAGIERVIECHGSFATASCLRCKYRVDAKAIKDDVFDQRIPYCPRCSPNEDEPPVVKPDIVFFGEDLPASFHKAVADDKDQCDLFIVIGSSLKVRPVALIPSSIPPEVPQILINREPLPYFCFDVELLGDCDVIINEICHRLGEDWEHACCSGTRLKEIHELPDDAQMQTDPIPSLSATVLSEIVTPLCDGASNPEVGRENQQSGSNSMEVSDLIQSGNGTGTANLEADLEITSPMAERQDDHVSQHSDTVSQEVNSNCAGQSQKPKSQESLACHLPENCFLHCPPNRYIFTGAEVYRECSDEKNQICDTEDSLSSSSSSRSDSSEDEGIDENEDGEDDDDDGYRSGFGLAPGHDRQVPHSCSKSDLPSYSAEENNNQCGSSNKVEISDDGNIANYSYPLREVQNL